MFRDALPAWERWSYWLFGVSSMAYSWWRLYTEGTALKSKYSLRGFRKGWMFLERDQDSSDHEWLIWRANLGRYLVMCLIHVALSQGCRCLKVSAKMRLCVLVLLDLAFVCAIFGPKVLVYFLLKTVVVHVTSRLAGIPGVWTVMGLLLFLDNVTDFNTAQDRLLGVSRSSLSHHFLVARGFFDIRLISFGVDNSKLKSAKHNDKVTSTVCAKQLENKASDIKLDKNSSETCTEIDSKNSLYVLEVLLYLFYFPSFLHGPVYLFQDFRQQTRAYFSSSSSPHSTNSSPVDYLDILRNLARIALWVLFIEVSLHFLYFSALAHNSMLKDVSLWVMVAVGHATGQYFMVKYVVIYGLPSQLARLDGVVPSPEPRCISWVYSYTDMWKYFDTGLYRFIKVYLFIPLGGSRHGILRQLAVSALVFFFIYLWHGGTYFLFIWCCGNFLVGSLESMACLFERSPQGQRLVSGLGPAMTLRVKCVLNAPAYLASCLQTFYFLFHVDDAWAITDGVLMKTTWTEFGYLMAVFYACIHNAKYVGSKTCKRPKDIS